VRVVLAIGLALAGGTAGAAGRPRPVGLPFATLDTGSAWYVYGAALGEVVGETRPPGSTADVKPRAGGVGNPILVAKNETPLGLGFTVTNRWAYEGREAYTQKFDNLRALVGGLDTYYFVAVASKRLALASVRDIKDKKLPAKIYTQPVGALGEFAGRQVLRALGVSYADVTGRGGTTTHVGSHVIADAFKDGRADVLFAVLTPK